MLTPDNRFYGRVQLLIRVLPQIAREPVFALKGGTAINLFVRDMPRLSVDIDLTYLPIEPREEALANIQAAMERISLRIQLQLRGARIISQQTKFIKIHSSCIDDDIRSQHLGISSKQYWIKSKRFSSLALVNN